MIIWRISNYADLSGRGGQVAPGRWHDQGASVVYCCDHPSTTLLEILVQIDLGQIPRDFQLLRIHCPDDIRVFEAPIAGQDIHDISITRGIGSRLLSENNFCLIRVPSAILPEAMNILINPRHPDAGRLTIEKAIRYPIDSRLFR
jgi:RES domain-containing protein